MTPVKGVNKIPEDVRASALVAIKIQENSTYGLHGWVGRGWQSQTRRPPNTVKGYGPRVHAPVGAGPYRHLGAPRCPAGVPLPRISNEERSKEVQINKGPELDMQSAHLN